MIDNPYRSEANVATKSDCSKCVHTKSQILSLRGVLQLIICLLVMVTVAYHRNVTHEMDSGKSSLRGTSKKTFHAVTGNRDGLDKSGAPFAGVNLTRNYKIAELIEKNKQLHDSNSNVLNVKTDSIDSVVRSKLTKEVAVRNTEVIAEKDEKVVAEREAKAAAEREALAAAEREAKEVAKRAQEYAEREEKREADEKEAKAVAERAAKVEQEMKVAAEIEAKVAAEREAEASKTAKEKAEMEMKMAAEKEAKAVREREAEADRAAKEKAEWEMKEAAEREARAEQAMKEAAEKVAKASTVRETVTKVEGAAGGAFEQKSKEVVGEKKDTSETEQKANEVRDNAATKNEVEDKAVSDVKDVHDKEAKDAPVVESQAEEVREVETKAKTEKIVNDKSEREAGEVSTGKISEAMKGDVKVAAGLEAEKVPPVVGNELKVNEMSAYLSAHTFVWLTNDEGVEVVADNSRSRVGHQVTKWNDQSHMAKFSHRYFSAMSDDLLSKAYRDVVKQHRQSSILHSASQVKLPSNQFHALYMQDAQEQSYVSFPCALVSSDSKFHLEERSSFFFVIRPTYPAFDDSSPGQNFFGHFPSGQFRLLRGEVSFRANDVDFMLPSGEGKVNLNEINILGYRFAGNQQVEISLNGSPFKSAVSTTWVQRSKNGLFSHHSPLYVGGTTSHCGFIGDIFEVVGFEDVISDDVSRSVLNFLSRKYLHNEVAIGGRHIPPEHESALSNVREPISPFGTNVKRRSPKRLDTTADVEKKVNSNFAKNYAEKVVGSLKKEEKETLKEEKRSDHLASTVQTDVCNSHDDPFKDSPVENFVPPKKADLKDVMMWEDALSDLKERIRKIKTGGKTLRDLIKKEVRALQLLRFQTFCKYVTA